MALLGPQQSSQANFVLDIASSSNVPIISSATSPDLNPNKNPYFIRIAQASSTQAGPLSALVKSFGWKEVVFIYEDTDFGRGAIPYLYDTMVDTGIQVKYHTRLSPFSTDYSILQQLHKLKTMQTRVFVVHMLPNLASRFFEKAEEVGLMTQGYVWIVTDVLTGLLHHLGPQDIDSMQGVLGVKPYIPPSDKLTIFEKKWRKRFSKEYPNMDGFELDMFSVWSYDFIFALATALQRVELETIFFRPTNALTDLATIGTLEIGSKILPMIKNLRFEGLSGDFLVVNGQLQTPSYQIVNVIRRGGKHVGFWNPTNGLSKQISNNQRLSYTTNSDDLGAIIWPGDTLGVPKGWETKTLRVGLPALTGFVEFMEAYRDPITNTVYTNGFCIDVFYAVIDAMPYVVKYEFIPYENVDGESAGDINDLVYQIVRGKFDMVAGDVAVLWNRSNYVDFTLPYSEAGFAMLVPVKDDDRKSAWIFMKPLETKLWITVGAFFIYTGLVVWVLERRVNKEFRGSANEQIGMMFWFSFSTLVFAHSPAKEQIGMMFWFSFSTLVFAHEEKLRNNLSRFVVIVWIFVVLVITSSYTASLSSMLTVQNLQPTVTNIYDLLARGHYVGYQGGSFVEGLLKSIGFPDDKLKKYNSVEEYAKALADGSSNNGVSAIVDGLPYLKLLQAKNCNKYLIVGPIYNTAGFGFAFPKGSPLVAEFSKAILKVVEGQMRNITDKWFGNQGDCLANDGEVQPFDKLTLASFKGLLVIAGLSSTIALGVYIVTFLYENKEILESERLVQQKIVAIIRSFIEIETETSASIYVQTLRDLMTRLEEREESLRKEIEDAQALALVLREREEAMQAQEETSRKGIQDKMAAIEQLLLSRLPPPN